MKYLVLLVLTVLCYTASASEVEVSESHADRINRLRKEYQNKKSVVVNYTDRVVKSGDIVIKVEYER